jgi:hypothetical protein
VAQGKGAEASPDGPVLWIALFIMRISDRISAAYWISHAPCWISCVSGRNREHATPWKRDSVFYGYYVLVWLALLLVLLFLGPMSGNFGLAVGWLALYRLQDMLLGTLRDIFAPNPYDGSWASKVAVVIVNIVQVVTIFAISFLVFTAGRSFHPSVRAGRFEYFYLSWNSLPPLGSGFAAETLRARIFAIIESGTGVLLILIALSRFLGKPEKGSAPEPKRNQTCPHIDIPVEGRLSSWMSVAIIITGFVVGGIAMVVGPTWWLFWTGAAIVVTGGILAFSWRIVDDWY